MIKFRDWVAMRESSPATRRRRASMLGLAPDIPDADMLGGHSTNPYYNTYKKKSKKKKKKK